MRTGERGGTERLLSVVRWASVDEEVSVTAR
jgi:hypothetical protein